MRAVFLLLVVGCADAPEHTASTGFLCAFENEASATRGFPEPQRFAAGRELTLAFSTRIGGCPPDLVARCSVSVGLAPRELFVDAYGAWNGPMPTECSRKIHDRSTTCTTPPLLADGAYVLHWEDQRITLTVPSTTTEPPCVSRLPGP